jgi:hypothetical protein
MNRLFPLPVFSFIKIAVKNGGISFKGLKNLPFWLIKTILLEPLRWVELTYNNKINRHVIAQDPVFVLGYYRSGTSFLHELLTKDDRFGHHTNFQMILPDMALSSEKILAPFFDFIFRLFHLQDPVHRVPLSLRFPGEEDGAMTTALNPRGAAWGHFFPQRMMEQFRKYVLFEGIPESEIESWKRDYMFLVKKISLAGGGKQLVLKSPPNTARVKQLLTLFPQAKFIFIHRNPYEVYTSNKQFWKVINKIYVVGSTRSVHVNDIILDTYAGIMDRYLQEKELIPEGQLIEVRYEHFIEQPMAQVRTIYETLRLGDLSHCEQAMQKHTERQKSFTRLKHTLPPDEQALANTKLERFLRHWNYPLL